MNKKLVVAMILSLGINGWGYSELKDTQSDLFNTQQELKGDQAQIVDMEGDYFRLDDKYNALLEEHKSLATKNVELSKRNASLSRGSTSRRSITVLATAYTHDGSLTKIETKPRVGVIAVDPNVIPLGTKVFVEGYGYATAEDTGRLIKGNRIDLFMDTEKECKKFGVKHLKIFIIN